MDNISLDKKNTTRTILSSYLVYLNDIKNIDLEIEEIENNYDLTGSSLEERTGHTYKINRVTENRFVSKREKVEELLKLKESHKRNCEKVENAINILKEFEKEVIELKYMTPPVMSWHTVSLKLGFSQIACQRAEERAVIKMVPLLIK
jgi:DNA-directed RNA polymerase specialized sigma subunit